MARDHAYSPENSIKDSYDHNLSPKMNKKNNQYDPAKIDYKVDKKSNSFENSYNSPVRKSISNSDNDLNSRQESMLKWKHRFKVKSKKERDNNLKKRSGQE